ncbi:hypothetical protein U91I_00452 [alpha proteobacterium U9-1i]|nr:hypothetical protein U91I_00452 [alpha proteobacterium U9-1i]
MLLRIARVLASDAVDFLPEAKSGSKRAKRSEDPQAIQLQNAFKLIKSATERKLVLDLALRLAQPQMMAPQPKRKPRR